MSVPSIEQNRIANERNPVSVPPRKFRLRELPQVQAQPPAPLQVDLAAVRQPERAARPRHLLDASINKTVEELKEETAKFIFDKHKTYNAGVTLVNEWVKHKRFAEIFEVLTYIYDLKLTVNQTKSLHGLFKKLTSRSPEAIGQPFYAWIRCALTRALEENAPNPTAEQIEQIIAGYQEAADLGSYFARYNLAIFYDTKLLRPDEARTHLIKYTEEHPERSFGFKELANFYLTHTPVQGDAAIEALRRGLRIDERDPTCAYVPAELALMLAELLGKSGDSQNEAISLYTTAKNDDKADPITRSKAAFNLGVILQTKKELTSALTHFRESKQHAAQFDDQEYIASVDFAIAETLLMDEANLSQEQNSEALRLIESAKREKNLEAELLHAKLLASGNTFVAKDIQKAIRALSRLEKMAKDNDPYIEFQSHLQLGSLAEPALATKSLLTANRLLAQGSLDMRETYLEQVDSAIKSQFEAIIEENKALKEQLEANAAKILKLEQELAKLNSAVRPETPPVTKSWQKDIEKQQAVLSKDPLDDEALFNLAFAHLEKGEYEEALKRSLEYTKRGKNNEDWRPWSVIARSSYKMGNLAAALKYINASLDLNDSEQSNIALKQEIKQALAKTALPKNAPQPIIDAPKSAPPENKGKDLYSEALKLYKAKKTSEALEKFKEIEINKLLPEKEDEILHCISMCYTRQKKFEAALYFANQAINTNKKCEKHYHLRAEILIAQKDFVKARVCINLIKQHGGSVDDLLKRLPNE